MGTVAEKPYRFEVGQIVKETVGTCSSWSVLVIKDRYRDWNVNTLSSDHQESANFYVVGEYGYENDTAMRFIECNLREWTLDDLKPGDAIAKSEKPGEYWVGIFKAYYPEMNAIRAYVYTHHARPNAVESFETPFVAHGMRPATLEERMLLKQKMDASGLKWDAANKQVIKELYSSRPL